MITVDQIVGCIVGGALGDALGGPHEGQQPGAAARGSGTGPLRLSDDTQLTLATCEAVTSMRKVDPAAIAASMVKWYRAGRIIGLGAATRKALDELARGAHWALVGRKGEMAAGNGAAMRIAPLAFWLDPDNPSQRTTIRDVCRITHHSDEAYVGALAVLTAIRAAVDGTWAGDATLLPYVARELPDSRVRDRLVELASGGEIDLQSVATKYGCSGYVVQSVPLALAAAQTHGHNFAEMLQAVIACGGDTDTNASIAGQVLGALVGRRGFPDSLVEQLPDREMVLSIATSFAEVSESYGVG